MLLCHIHPQIMVLEQMVLFLFMLQGKVQQEVLNCDMKLLSVACVSGFIARRVLRGINCDDCTTYLTSPMLLATNAFIYFKEYEEDKQLLTYHSEKLVETVGASISLLESKMAKVPHMGSVE